MGRKTGGERDKHVPTRLMTPKGSADIELHHGGETVGIGSEGVGWEHGDTKWR